MRNVLYSLAQDSYAECLVVVKGNERKRRETETLFRGATADRSSGRSRASIVRRRFAHCRCLLYSHTCLHARCYIFTNLCTHRWTHIHTFISMFRWHSTIVEPARTCATTSTAAATATPANDPATSSSQRIIEAAYRDMVDSGRGLDRDDNGKLSNPRALLRGVEAAGVRLGPQGAGTLVALADRVPIRPPSFQEFARCVHAAIYTHRGSSAAAAAESRALSLSLSASPLYLLSACIFGLLTPQVCAHGGHCDHWAAGAGAAWSWPWSRPPLLCNCGIIGVGWAWSRLWPRRRAPGCAGSVAAQGWRGASSADGCERGWSRPWPEVSTQACERDAFSLGACVSCVVAPWKY